MSTLKSFVQRVLQRLLGYKRYLFVFSNYKIASLKKDKNEKDFFHFLEQLPPNANILDVGANIGIMTYHLCHKAKNGKVLAIEPEPSNLHVLNRIISDHGLTNVEVLPKAVGSENGKITMILPVVGKVKKQGLSHVKDKSIETFNEGEEFEVDMIRIDDLDFVQKHTIHGIKLDVENYEHQALSGCIETIKRDKPLIYTELWDNSNRLNCFNLMQELGYHIKVWDGKALATYKPDQHHTQNFFFIPS